jgi:hypothetical protein
MFVSGQLYAPAALLREKNPRHLLDRRLDGPKNQPGNGGKEKKIPAPLGNQTTVIQPAA